MIQSGPPWKTPMAVYRVAGSSVLINFRYGELFGQQSYTHATEKFGLSFSFNDSIIKR
jgi:hypothetical protein